MLPLRPLCSRPCPEKCGQCSNPVLCARTAGQLCQACQGGGDGGTRHPESPGLHTAISFSARDRPGPQGTFLKWGHGGPEGCPGPETLSSPAWPQHPRRGPGGRPMSSPATHTARALPAPRSPRLPCPGPYLVVVGLAVGQALLLIVPVAQERLLTLGADKVLGGWAGRAASGLERPPSAQPGSGGWWAGGLAGLTPPRTAPGQQTPLLP